MQLDLTDASMLVLYIILGIVGVLIVLYTVYFIFRSKYLRRANLRKNKEKIKHVVI